MLPGFVSGGGWRPDDRGRRSPEWFAGCPVKNANHGCVGYGVSRARKSGGRRLGLNKAQL